MSEVVHSGATGVHLHNIGRIGLKQLLLMRKGIIKIHFLTSIIIYKIKNTSWPVTAQEAGQT
jgi:hypothetical protein